MPVSCRFSCEGIALISAIKCDINWLAFTNVRPLSLTLKRGYYQTMPFVTLSAVSLLISELQTMLLSFFLTWWLSVDRSRSATSLLQSLSFTLQKDKERRRETTARNMKDEDRLCRTQIQTCHSDLSPITFTEKSRKMLNIIWLISCQLYSCLPQERSLWIEPPQPSPCYTLHLLPSLFLFMPLEQLCGTWKHMCHYDSY